MVIELATAESMTFRRGRGRMVSWRGLVKAVEAKKAEGASFVAFLIPDSSCVTGYKA